MMDGDHNGQSNPVSGSLTNTQLGGMPSDSISKLQATMLKMATQVDGIGAEFDRILIRSGLSERALKLEEENARLRAELANVAGSRHGGALGGISVSPNVGSAIPGSPGSIRRHIGAKSVSAGLLEGNSQTDLSKAEETIKVYFLSWSMIPLLFILLTFGNAGLRAPDTNVRSSFTEKLP
jgi:hypothetical protein